MQGTQKWKISKEEEKLGPQGGVKFKVTKYQEARWREKLADIV